MAAYYNDHDKNACAWLRELIKAGLIADGEVDERSILDVRPVDLAGFSQCHFFTGIGGWSYALRLAGWPDDRPVWTGSPPCQPFSVAGRGLGREDARHLAPHFVGLVRASRPGVLFGEQVASAEVFGPSAKGNRPGFEGTPPWAWIDDLSDRLEAAHYAVGANDFPSAGVGAPHIRQRTFFGAVHLGSDRVGRLADRDGWERDRFADGEGRRADRSQAGRQQGDCEPECGGSTGRLADMHGNGCAETGERQPTAGRDGAFGDSAAGGLGDSFGARLEGHSRDGDRGNEPGWVGAHTVGSASEAGATDSGRPGPTNGFWASADWLASRDGKWRPVEPCTFPLAHGLPARVGRLRGYGNAINPHAAAEFVMAFMDAAHLTPAEQETSHAR